MERGELDAALAEEIRARTLGEGFMKIVQTVRRNGKTFRISMRPVAIGGETRYQAEMVDDGTVRVKNFDANGAAEGLEEIIAQKGARDLHLMTAKGDLHVRVTRKGHVMATRSAEMDRVAVVQPHDRVKKTPLASFNSSALLRVTGLADGDGRIRASQRGKYDQVNEFLKVVDDVIKDEPGDRPFTVVDCGYGKAYLTLALCMYLAEVKKFADVRVVGVDRREDVVAAASKMAGQLGLEGRAVFAKADLTEFDLAKFVPFGCDEAISIERADMVVSLHACDTATDEALARGVEWRARYIVSAPCCQHELQKALGGGAAKGAQAFAGLLRHGILRERLCDLLTDAFRAQLLRILGFRTQVVEFVSPDATARNILLRAEFGVKPGQAAAVSEYLDLRDFWQVTPWLETRLKGMLEKHLVKYE